MEVPLTPLEFARRTRRLHGHREGVVDGDLRLTYEQFFDRCDRWSAALQGLGVAPGDRVATIAPNTHAQLESFYAVPQIGAVLVPINYRLTADDFVSHHQPLRRRRWSAPIPTTWRRWTASATRCRACGTTWPTRAPRDGWIDYEAAIAAADPDFTRPEIGERDLLTINYTSGTTARPKGVMITHRNAAMNTIGTLLHLPIGVGERYLWTLPMFHANGWTYTWTVTAAAGVHVCLRKVDPADGVPADPRREGGLAVRRAHGADLAGERACRRCGGGARAGAGGDGWRAARGGHHRAAGGEFGWEVTQVYGLTETAPFITVCAPLPEHEELSLGRPGGGQGQDRRRADHLRRAAGGGREGRGGARRRPVARRDRGARERGHGRLLPRPRGDRAGDGRRLVPHRRRRRACTRTATSRSVTGSRT